MWGSKIFDFVTFASRAGRYLVHVGVRLDHFTQEVLRTLVRHVGGHQLASPALHRLQGVVVEAHFAAKRKGQQETTTRQEKSTTTFTFLADIVRVS